MEPMIESIQCGALGFTVIRSFRIERFAAGGQGIENSLMPCASFSLESPTYNKKFNCKDTVHLANLDVLRKFLNISYYK